MYYDELVLEALFQEGIIDEELYEKCKKKYVITFDDIQGIKMSIDGNIKQIKTVQSEFEKFQKGFMDKDDWFTPLDDISDEERRNRFYEEWKKGVEEFNNKSSEKEKKLQKELGDWYSSLEETLNKSDSRKWEHKAVDTIYSWRDDVKDHRKTINGIPVVKSWDNKNKTKYLKYLKDFEDKLDKLRQTIRKG